MLWRGGPKTPLETIPNCCDKSVSEYSTSDQDKILSSAFRTDREDIFFEEKTIKKHFNKKIKSKTVLLRTNSF